jgi:hypothetical protein
MRRVEMASSRDQACSVSHELGWVRVVKISSRCTIIQGREIKRFMDARGATPLRGIDASPDSRMNLLSQVRAFNDVVPASLVPVVMHREPERMHLPHAVR